MKKIISLITAFNLIFSQSALANWVYYGDSQQDSLPIPGGEFEITGIAIKEDEEFVYIAIQANRDLLTGVEYKTANIFAGDLFINELGVRTTPFNNSGLDYGALYTDLTYKSISPLVFGQSTLAEYGQKVRDLGQIPYNGTNSPIVGELANSGQFVSKIEYLSPTEAGLPDNLGTNLTIVKIPKIFFPDLKLNISFSLECLNDILSISHTISPIPVDVSIPSFSFQGFEELDNNFPILEVGAASVGIFVLLLLFSGDSDIMAEREIDIPIPKPVPDTSKDIPERSSFISLLSLFLLRKKKWK